LHNFAHSLPRVTRGYNRDTLAERLLDIQYYWESAAKPFEWKFSRQDLNQLLTKLHPLRRFRILSRGTQFRDGTPDLYVDGTRRYSANLNTSNHIGVIQSIGHTSRSLDPIAAKDQHPLASLNKT
jgi:hypothetical protein